MNHWGTIDKLKVIKLYRSGLNLRQVAKRMGCSMQNIHLIIKSYYPSEMRKPHVRYKKENRCLSS